MNIGVSFQLRFEEYRLAIRLLSRGRLSLWYAVAGFVLFGACFLALRHGTEVVGVMFLFVAGVYAVQLTFGARARLRKRFAVASEPTGIVFGESHFTIETEHTRAEVKWTGVVDILETPELFLLYQARRVAIIVPTRAFSQAQLGEFRTFLGVRRESAATAVHPLPRTDPGPRSDPTQPEPGQRPTLPEPAEH